MMTDPQHPADNNESKVVRHMIASIVSGICAIGLATACIYLYINDEVIPGEGQDPIVMWIFLISMGLLWCAVCCVACLYEYLSQKKNNRRDLLVFWLSAIFVALSLTCGIMSLKTIANYGPGQRAQTCIVEEADFRITFPQGLTPVEETSEGAHYYNLYAFSKTKTISVHIRPEWKPEEWTDADFKGYVKDEFKKIFRKKIFDRTKVIRFKEFDAIRIVGKTANDSMGEFRAIYDLLHGSTYVRVVIMSGNLSGEPNESFINDCDILVRSIRFGNL